jgi:hypothetical protein
LKQLELEQLELVQLELVQLELVRELQQVSELLRGRVQALELELEQELALVQVRSLVFHRRRRWKQALLLQERFDRH